MTMKFAATQQVPYVITHLYLLQKHVLPHAPHGFAVESWNLH